MNKDTNKEQREAFKKDVNAYNPDNPNWKYDITQKLEQELKELYLRYDMSYPNLDKT
jgi:hypothetical protein